MAKRPLFRGREERRLAALAMLAGVALGWLLYCAYSRPVGPLPYVCIQVNARGCGWSVARLAGETDEETRARVARDTGVGEAR